MTFEQNIAERINDIVEKRGIRNCSEKISECIKNKKNLNAVEFLAICKMLNLNFDDFKGC